MQAGLFYQNLTHGTATKTTYGNAHKNRIRFISITIRSYDMGCEVTPYTKTKKYI